MTQAPPKNALAPRRAPTLLGRARRLPPVEWLVSYLFGDDVFISYSRRDGDRYGEELAHRLSDAGYSVRMDLWETQPGKETPEKVMRALRRSRNLVVVATPCALQSPHVAAEVTYYKSTHPDNMNIIPLHFGDGLPAATWFEQVEGLPWLRETDAAYEAPAPSDPVVTRIRESLRFTRRNRRLFKASVATLAAVLLLTALGVAAGVGAFAAYVAARVAELDAAIAQENAAFQRSQAREAEVAAARQTAAAASSSVYAEWQTLKAENEALEARRQAGLARDAARAAGDARELERRARELAAEQQSIATSRRLAGWADRKLDEAVDLSLLLAQAAYDERPTFEAERSLLSAFRAHPGLEFMLRPSHLRPEDNAVTELAVTPDGGTFITAVSDGQLIFWDAATRKPRPEPVLLDGSVSDMALSRDGRKLVVIHGGMIQLWDVPARTRVRTTKAGGEQEQGSSLVALHPGNNLMVTDGPVLKGASSGDGNQDALHIWDISDLHSPSPRSGIVHNVDTLGRRQYFTALAFSPDGTKLLAGGAFGSIWLWEKGETWESPRFVRQFEAHRRPATESEREWNPVTKLVFSPDGTRLVSVAAADGELFVWDAQTMTKLYSFKNRRDGVAFSPDGKLLAAGGGSEDETLSVWNVESPLRHGERSLLDIARYRPGLFCLAFSPDGKSIISGNDDGTVAVWRNGFISPQVSLSPLVRVLTGKKVKVTSTAFSPDGLLLASGDEEGGVTLNEVGGEAPAAALTDSHKAAVRSLAFNRDRSLLASGSDDGALLLWDAQGGWRPSPLSGTDVAADVVPPEADHPNAVKLVAFVEGGRTLISFGPGRQLVHWDVGGRRELRRLPLPAGAGEIISAAASRDGRKVALGSADNKVYFYDARRPGLGFQSLEEHENAVAAVAFSNDGRSLTSADRDGMVIVWKLGAPSDICFRVFPWERTDQIVGLGFGHDDRTLTVAVKDVGLLLWDIESHSSVGIAGVHPGGVTLSVAPGGRRVATGAEDGGLFLWDVDYASWARRAKEIASRDFLPWESFELVRPEAVSGCKSPPPASKAQEQVSRRP